MNKHYKLRSKVINLMINNNINDMLEYMEMYVRDAYIAGNRENRQLGLNVPVEDRADEYCKKVGLRV